MQILGTLIQALAAMASPQDQIAVRNGIAPLTDRYSSCSLNSAGLVIKAGGSTLAKIGATDYYAVANGVPVKVAASTDMPALTGMVIAANTFNFVAFFVDAAGVVTAALGTQGATLAQARYPQMPKGKALIGALLITHSSTFTGGTTPLDTATTVYINGSTAGAFDPSALLGF
jgi:hypothetical protein